MIEVNLLPGPKRKRTAAGPSFSLDDLRAALAKVKDPLLLAAVGGWAAGIGVIAFLYLMDTRAAAAADADLTRVEAEHRRFSALIAQKRKAEGLRDSLVAELTVIRRIDDQRYVWPHIFEEVTRALPDYTWLVSIQPAAGGGGAATDSGPPRLRIEVGGRTTDIQAYTRFLRQLGSSPWIRNITAGATTTVMELDRQVTAFSLTATYQQADSAYLRTAPLGRGLP